MENAKIIWRGISSSREWCGKLQRTGERLHRQQFRRNTNRGVDAGEGGLSGGKEVLILVYMQCNAKRNFKLKYRSRSFYILFVSQYIRVVPLALLLCSSITWFCTLMAPQCWKSNSRSLFNVQHEADVLGTPLLQTFDRPFSINYFNLFKKIIYYCFPLIFCLWLFSQLSFWWL